MPDIVAIGECLIELSSDKPIVTSTSFQKSFAGDTINFLVAVSRLGNSAGYITRVANDPFKKYLLGEWKKESIDCSEVKSVDGFNGMHFVSRLPYGEREFIYYRSGSAASTMQPSDINPRYIASAKLLHISGIPQAISPTSKQTILHAAKIAKDNNVPISYDPNYRHQLWNKSEARDAMAEILPYITYLFPSCPTDTEALLSTDNPRTAIKAFIAKGVAIVAVTCGNKGVLVGTGKEVFEVPAYTPNTIIDTTGAGDAFNGGFMHAILEGLDIKDASLFGIVTAGLKLETLGALTGLPKREQAYEIFHRIKNQM